MLHTHKSPTQGSHHQDPLTTYALFNTATPYEHFRKYELTEIENKSEPIAVKIHQIITSTSQTVV